MADMPPWRRLSGEHASLADASLGEIIGTGLLLGVVHVLTGPDHLSALAAMTTNSSWRAFTLGLRWGCGHSLGLLIMALIFFAAGRSVNLDEVGVYCNYVVGVFMIALGLWTMYQVKRKYHDKAKLPAVSLASNGGSSGSTRSATRISASVGVVNGGATSQSQSQSQLQPSLSRMETRPSRRENPSADSLESGELEHGASGSPRISSYYLLSIEDETHRSVAEDQHQHEHQSAHSHQHGCGRCLPQCCRTWSLSSPTGQRVTALIVGIVHGIAGPGGILGVLPAVVMDDWAKSTAYLASFCVASIFIMGVFAALYGEITGRLGRNSLLMEYRIGVFSAAFSLVVGVAWITLQATGQFDKFFE